MRRFHSLTVADVREEAQDARRVLLDVPTELRDEFAFQAGQHLPVEIEIGGQRIRRTYSICSTPGTFPLEIGIRIQPGGLFSTYVAETLQPGDTLSVMPPFGRFHAGADVSGARTCLAFAAGSGITPVLSIMRETLERHSGSRFVLFYGNRRQDTTMFIDELYALKNRFPARVQLCFLFSQEEQEFDIFGGRLDAGKVRELCERFCAGLKFDEVFVCGPDTMLDAVRDTLIDLGTAPDAIRVERYGPPRRPQADVVAIEGGDHDCEVTVILDGHRKSFFMSADGPSIVDAAADNGIDLPFSCKGGVCATCRTHVRSGDVCMTTNYGLETWEVESGYVLACQSRPVSSAIVLDYDKT